MEKYFIGIDLGGTTTRAAVYDALGNELAVCGKETELLTPFQGHTERDMATFEELTFSCIKEAVAKSKIDAKAIGGIGLSGHGKGLYLLDENGDPVRNGIISTDTRGAEYVKTWQKDGTEQKARKLSCQSVLVSQPCVLLRWLKDNERKSYEKIAAILEAKDYIRYCLTGVISTEYTDISGTNLLNLKTKSYDEKLLSLFGIKEMQNCLPPIKNSFEVCGCVTERAAKLCEIPCGIPVAGGMFDIDSCALAAGITDGEDLCVIAGTWSINEYLSKSPITDGSVAMNSLSYLNEYYLVEESSPTSAGNLSWYLNGVLSEDKKRAKEEGRSVYDKLNEEVERRSDKPLYFLPYVFGSQNDASSKGAFIGIDSSCDKYDLAKAVMEGVAFNHKMHVEKLLASRKDDPPKKIRLAGGAAHSKVWLKILSNVLNMPIQSIKCDELGALGAAISAAVACGEYPSAKAAVENMVRLGETTYPYVASAEYYDEKYKTFKALEEKLRGM